MNVNAMSKNNFPYANSFKGGGKGKTQSGGKPHARSPSGSRPGKCNQWLQSGQCSRGDSCPWLTSHTSSNAGVNAKSGKGKRNRSGSPKGKGNGKKGTRSPSPPKIPKQGDIKIISPSKKTDRPPCFKYLEGNCTNANCDYWHLPCM